MIDTRKLFDAIRDIKRAGVATGKAGLLQSEVDAINRILLSASPLADPPWLVGARKDIGLAEIPGKATSPRIMQMLVLLNYPFRDDETPWCGTGMAAWFREAGIAPPQAAYRAANWRDWGVPCAPQLGAVGVKSRDGGNHVTMLVGITDDGKYYKGLGANQSNKVTVADFPVGVIDSIRWPTGVAERNIALPVMPYGTISTNEA